MSGTKTCTVLLLHDPSSSEPVSVIEVREGSVGDVEQLVTDTRRQLEVDGIWTWEMWIDVIQAVPLRP